MLILLCFGSYLLSLALVGLYFIGHLWSFFMSNESKKNQQQIKDPIVQPFLVGCVKLV